MVATTAADAPSSGDGEAGGRNERLGLGQVSYTCAHRIFDPPEGRIRWTKRGREGGEEKRGEKKGEEKRGEGGEEEGLW